MDAPSDRSGIRELLGREYAWTSRQRQVLDLIAAGHSNAEVAEALGVSLDGAKWHMREILSKLSVDTREEAAEYWRRYNGWHSRFARVFRGLLLAQTVIKAGVTVAVAILATAAVAVAVMNWPDGNTPASPAPTETRPTPGGTTDTLARVQAAIDKAGTYRITVAATNFVLPQWGGSDSGTVEVDSAANRTRAVLDRTGEGGPYTIVWANGQTVFQRATCRDWARIPGSGTNVLAPFILAGNGALAKHGGKVYSQDEREVLLHGTIETLGPVTIVVDPATQLPRRIERRVAGSPDVIWTFSDWGKKLDIPAPKASYDRGPGGNPC